MNHLVPSIRKPGNYCRKNCSQSGARARKTALFVTHDIDESIYLATRLIVFTARPGRIKADFRLPDIDRTGAFRKSKEYLDLRGHVWDLLREEVLKARALEDV